MSTQASILIVEDDREIGTLVKDLLQREGYQARLARSGTEMDLSLQRDGAVDLIVLDLMLPGEDGLAICRRLRARSRVAILMLTAKREDIDRIIGLELGADDYLPKPFHPRELIARIRAILRRTGPPSDDGGNGGGGGECLFFGDFEVDVAARQVRRRDGHVVDVHGSEYELLLALLNHPQRVLSRDQLMDWTKGRSWQASDRSIDVAMSRLRRRIETDPSTPILIKTVRNGGYLLTVPVERR